MIPVILDRYYRNLKKKFRFKETVLGIISLCLVLISVNLLIFKCPDSIDYEDINQIKELNKPTYMLHGDHLDSGYLEHVIKVLDRLGLRRIENSTSFNLLWSHPYPYGEQAPFTRSYLQNLRPYQKVNHFPGSGYFTNKVDLATSDLKHVPKAFNLPDQKSNLLEYSKANPNRLFVQKSNSHRGVKILKIDDMNLNLSGTFVQEYVQKPLLVDGHKFDIGIYTILTSVDPLRVYIYNGDFLLRFCPKKYYPFDPEDVDKYVVGDDYVPIWETPSLKDSYVELKFGMKETLNIYLRKQGKNPEKIWNQIEESIRSVFLVKEERIISVTNRFRNVGNFFEMVRFDFIVDDDLNVYLMEANMSPNLSSQHFKPNILLYENVLYSLFSLVGVGRKIRTGSLTYRNPEEAEMEVPDKNLMVYGDECSGTSCRNCNGLECSLCRHCLTDQSFRMLKQAYLEHVNKIDCKRIFPPSFEPGTKMADLELENYSPENRFMMLWFLGKCQLDQSWC